MMLNGGVPARRRCLQRPAIRYASALENISASQVAKSALRYQLFNRTTQPIVGLRQQLLPRTEPRIVIQGCLDWASRYSVNACEPTDKPNRAPSTSAIAALIAALVS